MVIINADDFGISPEVNEAIVRCFNEGIISSTTIMMNMPYAKDAVLLAFEHGFEDSVGLHFNIIEGKPLTEKIKKCKRICREGKFNYRRNTVKKWSSFEKEAIREEFDAQLNALIDLGILPSHIDSHQHTHTELPIFNIIKKSIKIAGVCKIRATRNVGISKLRILVKNLINTYFKFCGFKVTKYFNDIAQREVNSKLDNIEIMCHPKIIGNDIIDCCRNIIIEKQFEKLNKYKEI